MISSALDTEWLETLRRKHAERSQNYVAALGATPAGNDGRMHPNRFFAALRDRAHAPALVDVVVTRDTLSSDLE